MGFGDYLEQKQPVLFQTFSNALSTYRLAHSYLIQGEAGTPLKETALYLAKSILCDHPSPLACDECITCQRIVSEEYPDLIVFDGEEETIKKEAVENIVASFQKTPLENKGVMIYVLHACENMTPEAANALLKFLEEPTDYAYAILTTRNKERLLPTIVSRCETLPLFLLPREESLEEAIRLEVPQEDAELLSFVINDGPSISLKSKEQSYQNAKQAFLDTLDALGSNASQTRFVLERKVAKSLDSKITARYYFDFLALAYKDRIAIKRGSKPLLPSYAKILDAAAEGMPSPEKTLLSIMTLRKEAETPIHTGLLLTHLSRVLTKE